MITPSPISFEALRDLTPGTVSERLPIVLWEDRATSDDFTHAYRHVDFMSVYIARQGCGVHLVEEVPFEVQAGDVYAMGVGMSHRFDHSRDLVLDAIHFKPGLFPPATLEALSSTEGLATFFLGDGGEASRWLRLSPADRRLAAEMVEEMREEWGAVGLDRALMVQAALQRLLVFLARRRRRVSPSGSPVVSRARAAIELRYAEPLMIGDLAASAFLSTGRFTELFRAEVGCSPREYLGRIRIQAAKRLLRTTNLPISDVAGRTGFPDPAYFTRFFRRQVGLPPSEFRGSKAEP